MTQMSTRFSDSPLLVLAALVYALAALVSPLDAAAQAAPSAPPAQGAAPEVVVQGRALTLTSPGALPRRFTLACDPVAQRLEADPARAGFHWLYVACAQRVFRIEIGPEGPAIVNETALERSVVGSHDTDTDTWLELEGGGARSIRDLRSAAQASGLPPVPAAPTAPAAPAGTRPAGDLLAQPRVAVDAPTGIVVGAVTELRPEDRAFVIDLGSEDGLHAGMRVAVSSGGVTLERENVVVARVTSTTAHSALVALSYNDRVQVGQRVELADARSRSTSLRVGEWPYRAALRLNLRPALVVDNLGTTLEFDGEALVHLGVGMLALRVSPTGYASARRDPSGYGDTGANFGFGGAYLLGGVDLGFVSAGLGVGVARVFRDAGYLEESPELLEPVLTLPFRVRVGREDGAHGEATQIVGIQDERLQWLGVEVRGQLPIGPIWLFVDAAGGRLPAFHGIVGARVPLRGNGEPGSWSLRVGAGAAGTTYQSPAEELRVGPAIQVGLDARL